MSEEPGSITTIVNDLARGGAGSGGPMIERLQRELEAIARTRLRTLGQDAEVRTGDLVNEAYLKLFASGDAAPWDSRRHFFGSAARAMQQVVVDLLRKLDVRKAHATRIAVPIETGDDPTPMLPAAVLIQLIDELERADPVAAEVVRMRVFAGLTVSDAANVLGIPLRTAQRKWTIGRGLARAWLAERMHRR